MNQMRLRYLDIDNVWKDVPGQVLDSAANAVTANSANLFSFLALVPAAATVVEGNPNFVPTRISLEQNYPNPFNPSTTIRYGLPGHVHVVLDVFTILGQKVAELVNADMEAGYHEVQFHGDKLGSGIYFYRLQVGDFTETRTLVLTR